MKYYQLTFDSARRQFAWAGAYGPIDDLSFLPPAFLERKRAFWRINPMQPGIEIVSGGKKWPDVLGCGYSPPVFFLSERVVQSLGRMAPLGKVVEMPIAEIKAKALKEKTAPRYFVVQTIPGIEVDFAASNIAVDAAGQPISTAAPVHLKLRVSSWNGAEVLGFSNYGTVSLAVLCTVRVTEVAKAEGWTNVSWKEIDGI